MTAPATGSGIEGLPPALQVTLAAGRLWATRAAPYLSHAVLALRPVLVLDRLPPGADLTAFPVDTGWNLYVDPQVLAEATPADVGFWHLHHATHLLRRHHARSPATEPGTTGRSRAEQWWNQACDAETNDDLVPTLYSAGLAVPARALLPTHLQQPDGQLAEGYFRRQLEAMVQPPDPVADCGSGVDGHPRPWDIHSDALSAMEGKLLAADVARRIRDSVGGREPGTTAGGWRRWADEILNPVVDWRRQLAAVVRNGRTAVAGRVDYSYHRPSRRASTTPGVVLPVLRRPVPTIAVVVDTSGSMSSDLLGQALAEVAGLITAAGGSAGRDAVRLISCDSQAADAQRVLKVRDVELTGGGGTDMGAGLAAAAALRPSPDLVIVFTDGHTPWPPKPPATFRVVVGLLNTTSGTVPPWATRILIQPPRGTP